MRKNILLFSSAYHSFILNEMAYAAKEFETVILLCPYNDELKRECEKWKNVEYLYKECNLGVNPKNLFYSLKSVRLTMIPQVISAIIHRKMDYHYVYIIFSYLLCTSVLRHVYKTRMQSNPEKWVVLSMWFSQTAYAASRIKSINEKIACFSLAHSFEVDDRKNRYIDFSFKKFCHNFLDHIFFISQEVMDEYVEEHMNKNGWKKGNISVYYLGTIKKFQKESTKSEDDCFRLVSCSNCIEVKRIDLILDALDAFQSGKIVWTHIGDGILYKSLVEKSKKIKNSNVTIQWMGCQTNEFIHKFFIENPIDGFINTSYSEGIPVSIMEAIAYGIPVIATDVGGNSEIIQDGINGYLLNEMPSTDEINESIIKLLLNSEIDIMKRNAIKIFESKFNADKLRPDFYRMLRNND